MDPAGEQDTVKHEEKGFSEKLPAAAEYISGFVKNPPAISKVIMQCSPHLSNVLSNNINAEDIRNYQSQHMTEDRRLCNS